MSASETPSAASYHSLFTEALKNYKRKTGQDPTAQALVVQLGRCTSPEEVTGLLQREAERLDATHKSRWRTRMFEKIAPIVEIIRPLCDTAGKATGLVRRSNRQKLSSVASVSSSRGYPGRLIGAFALLTQRMSPGDASIRKALKRRLKRVRAMLFGDREIESMLKRLDELTKAEHLMTTAQTRRDVSAVKREQRRQERIREAGQYRSWLSSPNSSTNQVTASDARFSDTSMWLVRGKVYKAWKSSGTLLWVTGKLVKDLQDSLRSSRSSVSLAYFYCDFNDKAKQSYRGLLGSLLMSLSTRSDESHNILRKLFSGHKDGDPDPDIKDLMRCLEEMLVQPDDAKYIIVDALDEMPAHGASSDRGKTLELMSWLIGLRLPGLRLCVISRPEDDIGQVLTSLASHRVALDEEREHREDIARLIRSTVKTNKKMQKWGDSIKEEAIEALSRKADGMFRYVSCQLDVLCEVPLSTIRSTLKSLPTTLYDTYKSELGRISKEKRKHAHRLFQCLSFSTRPLTVEELAEVLAVSIDEEVPIYHNDWRSDDPESAVLSTCPGSFIQVISEDKPSYRGGSQRIVQFAHLSVKEFLTSDQLAKSRPKHSRFHILPKSSHTVLAKACLGILLRPKAVASAPVHSYLETYAMGSWDTHARFEDVSTLLLEALKPLFDPTKPHFAAWAYRRESDSPWHQPGTPLYFAALCGLPTILKLLLDSGADINSEGGKHQNVLLAAVSNGRLDAVRLLLDYGAEIDTGKYKGSALYMAIWKGDLSIIRLLLDRGANVNALRGEYGGGALQEAVMSKILDFMRSLAEIPVETDEESSAEVGVSTRGEDVEEERREMKIPLKKRAVGRYARVFATLREEERAREGDGW
ncbi:hypothetical protein BC834DRAFT_840668 [Gloeopeniophorella convolvens]|nr:hypothetical protein BC834DRAFT_840668 [Gloeopeniophorella convolvens]